MNKKPPTRRKRPPKPVSVSLRPGELFTVSYGDGETVEVVSLNMDEQRELAKIMRTMVEAETSGDPLALIDMFDDVHEALSICIPDVTDEFRASIDTEDAYEICMKCLGKQRISSDVKKKSGSRQ